MKVVTEPTAKDLKEKIQKIEGDIVMWSQRDRNELPKLEAELRELNMQLLDIMVDGNV